jgi:hypothetical protein
MTLSAVERVCRIFELTTSTWTQLQMPALLESFGQSHAPYISRMHGSDVVNVISKLCVENEALKDVKHIFQTLLLLMRFELVPQLRLVTLEQFKINHPFYVSLPESELSALCEFYNIMKCGVSFFGSSKGVLLKVVGYLTAHNINGKTHSTGGAATDAYKRREALFVECGGKPTKHLLQKRLSPRLPLKRSDHVKKEPENGDTVAAANNSSDSFCAPVPPLNGFNSAQYTSFTQFDRNDGRSNSVSSFESVVDGTDSEFSAGGAGNRSCDCMCMHCGSSMVSNKRLRSASVYAAVPLDAPVDLPVVVEGKDFKEVFDDLV